MKAESFQKGRLRYYPCPKCGQTHPSLTTILDVIGSPALMGWMAKNGTAKLNHLKDCLEGYRTDVSTGMLDKAYQLAESQWLGKEKTAFWKSGKESGNDAADIGTMCHAWIEAYLHGRRPSLEALPPEGRRAVMSMLTWEAQHKLETIATEQTFFNCKLNYAGTADWLGTLDGELSLGDWKTSSGVFFNYVVQGWGYVLADETQNAARLYRQIFIGRFGKDGSSETKIFKRNDFPGIETARDILIACGHIFGALQEWDQKFPYRPKKKIQILDDSTTQKEIVL